MDNWSIFFPRWERKICLMQEEKLMLYNQIIVKKICLQMQLAVLFPKCGRHFAKSTKGRFLPNKGRKIWFEGRQLSSINREGNTNCLYLTGDDKHFLNSEKTLNTANHWAVLFSKWGRHFAKSRQGRFLSHIGRKIRFWSSAIFLP